MLKLQEKGIKILEALNKENDLNQRELSKKTGLSLGNVNSTIKDLMEKEFIIFVKEDNKIFYNLTKNGLNIIGGYLKKVKVKKINLHSKKSKQIRQAVILAAGKADDFKKPVGFLEVEDITLIERTIELLFLQNIEKIVIVTGYESEYFTRLLKDNRICLVKSDRYKWTGTMYSLSLAANLINDDFILIESDILFEERTLDYLVKNKNRDCILITNESGSGDEAFVEIRNEFIYKMSKDIHQLNKINGEMIGISKISYEVFAMMLEEFKRNVNPYLNYEYLLMDIGRDYDIGYIKIDDLIWAEIDNMKHYESVINHIFPNMKRKELSIRIENIKGSISEVLMVKKQYITNIEHMGGMTNNNYKFTMNGENFVLRLAGAGTSEMIIRKNEKINSKLAYENGFDTEVIFFDDEIGMKISRFIENTETLNGTTAKKEENMRQVANILKKLHTSGIKFENRFDIFNLIIVYENLLKKYNGMNFDDYASVREKVMNIKKYIPNLDIVETACHNDTVPENFVKNGEERMYLIDWEYSAMNDPMWDLAAYSLECEFTNDEEELFLNIYFNGNIESRFKSRMIINKILQDFLWSIWTNIKEAKGVDFGTYGVNRYERCKKNLQLLKNMSNL